jgi:hypothetical protein
MKGKGTETKSRRVFLNKGLLTGIGAWLGLTSFKSVEPGSAETVKMLTSDGKLVEVDKKYLPKKRGKRISNRELWEWITK